jgi:hypothetical protein
MNANILHAMLLTEIDDDIKSKYVAYIKESGEGTDLALLYKLQSIRQLNRLVRMFPQLCNGNTSTDKSSNRDSEG